MERFDYGRTRYGTSGKRYVKRRKNNSYRADSLIDALLINTKVGKLHKCGKILSYVLLNALTIAMALLLVWVIASWLDVNASMDVANQVSNDRQSWNFFDMFFR